MQLQAPKPGSSCEEAGMYFSLVIVFIQHRCFSRLDSLFFNAAKAGITDHELWEFLRIYYTKSGDLSLWCWAFQCCEQVGSVVCLSRAMSHPFLSKPALSLKDPCGAQQSSTGAKASSVLLLKGIHENFCLWHIHGDRVLPKTHTKGINSPEIWILFASYQNIHSKPRRHSTAKHWQEEMLIKY